MLPSNKRLSRVQFTVFLGSKDLKTVFNQLGTLKYRKSLANQASIVISSKHEKRAVYRNKLRRRIYSAFREYFKLSSENHQYVLYVSKQAPNFSFQEIKTNINDLFKKITK